MGEPDNESMGFGPMSHSHYIRLRKMEVDNKADAKEKAELQRREVFVSGHVQCVGFRYTTQTLAKRFAVTGFVRNLSDARVQLVVEGQPKEIEAFLVAIRREMEKNISKTVEIISLATGEFQGLEFACRPI